jgi:hypothetical protein
MCTVSWLHDESGYQLFCNRDEKLTRLQARSPRIGYRSMTRFLAPVDGDFGGTWLATNEFGLSLCVLNGEDVRGLAAPRRPNSESRGLLLLRLIDAASIDAVRARLAHADLSAFAAFTLVVLEPRKPTAVVRWNGVAQSETGVESLPLTSSSFDADGVRRARLAEYLRLTGSEGPDAKTHFAFHKSHGGGPGPYSTCMHRVDAETVSFTWVKVTPVQADYFYLAGPPCRPGAWKIATLHFTNKGSKCHPNFFFSPLGHLPART